MKNLIYLVAFRNKLNIRLFELFLSSLVLFNKESLPNLDILVITEEGFAKELEDIGTRLGHPIQTWILPSVYSVFLTTIKRYTIFSWPNLLQYDTVMYCDTDILVRNNLETLFSLLQDPSKLYTVKEGVLSHDFWGGNHFFEFEGADSEINPNQEGVCTGVFLFKPNRDTYHIFDTISRYIFHKINQPGAISPMCYDQPYVNYVLAKHKFHENTTLSSFVINRPQVFPSPNILYHFMAVTYTIKYQQMITFLETMMNTVECDATKVPIVQEYLQGAKQFLSSYDENSDPHRKYAS